MTDGENLLLAHSTGKNPNIWDLPKGNIDKGESEKQAAMREFYEETGQKINLKGLRKIRKFNLHPTKDVILFTYSVEKLPPVSSLKCLSFFQESYSVNPFT